MLIGALVVAFSITFLILRMLLGPFASLALDRPDERSLHSTMVPRTGGIAVLSGTAVSLGFGAAELWIPLSAAFLVAAVSFMDDLHSLPVGLRFVAHLLLAGLVAWSVLDPSNVTLLVLLTLAIAWLANLYNFMDGSDGLAGGMAVVGFGTYALAGLQAGDSAVSVLCLAIAAASAAFLLYNFHPARIFLGDVGSVPLGFLAGALGVVGWQNGDWPLWFPVLVFGPFIGDATITLLRRLVRGERVWQAHREHYYQRMVRMGFGHRGTALLSYVVMAVCAFIALLANKQSMTIQATLVGAAVIVLGMTAIWIDIRWSRFKRESTKGA